MTDPPLIVALDHAAEEAARRCVEGLGDDARHYKVGSALFTRAGPPFVRELTGRGLDVFLDLKFHDTPATVAAAVAAAADLGAGLLTVHAAGGGPMIAAAREAIDRSGAATRLLAVTVLTSLSPEEFERVTGGGRGLAESVVALARLAVEAGAHGCVASAREVGELRSALGPGPLLVVPGIRPAWSAADHAGQARTASPGEAIREGATHLVLGRAVTAAPDPLAALRRIRREIAA